MTESLTNKIPRRWNFRKLTVCILTGILVFSLLSMVASAVVFDIMFARRELTPDSLEWSYSEIDTARYPRTSLPFYSGENRLQGYFYGTGREEAIILVVHGIGAGADSHLAETLFFADRGWAVFTFDGTGSRESEGRSLVGFSQMTLDLLAAIRTLSAAYPEKPIFLYGHSMGAYASAAVLNDCPEVKGAALLAGFDRPVDTMYHHAALRVGPVAAVEYPFLVLHNTLLFGEDGNESAISAINSCATPVLVIQGSQDDTVPEAISIYGRRQRITNPNVRFLLLEEPQRNRHSTLWRSADSAAYLQEKNDELTALREQYGSPLSGSVLDSFLRDLDKARLFGLDPGFMESICEFYRENLPGSFPETE